MLIRDRNAKVRKNHRNEKEIVQVERILDQIAREE